LEELVNIFGESYTIGDAARASRELQMRIKTLDLGE